MNKWDKTVETMQFDFFTLSEAHYKQRYQVGEISYHTLAGALSMLGQFRDFCTGVRRMEPPLPERVTKELLQQYKLFCLEKYIICCRLHLLLKNLR